MWAVARTAKCSGLLPYNGFQLPADDAAIYRLSDDLALVLTTDFFTDRG